MTSHTTPERAFRAKWAVTTLAAALLVSVADALLLERSRGYFTGGFLSIDYLRTWGQAAAFLSFSLIVDAALIGISAATAALLLSRFGLHVRAGLAAGTLGAAGAVVGADIVSYEVMRYLGDAFDLGLMFDLTGGSVAEILAVSGGFLVQPFVLGGVCTLLGVTTVVVVHRRSGDKSHIQPSLKALTTPVVLSVLGLLTLAGAAAASDTMENGLLRKPSGRVFAFLINSLSDVDGDGYGIVGRIVDSAPLNAAVFPYAPDIPGNGIDEDAVAGDLAVADVRREPEVPDGRWQQRPDVVLFVLESFRADMVGLRQNGTPVTPAIDALAANGVSVRSAYSHNGYTIQSRYHLLSGYLSRLPERGTLIDDFKANGYVVGYFSGQDESFGGEGYDVGFTRADVAFDARSDQGRRYSTTTTPGSLAVPLAVVEERVEEFVRSRGDSGAPLFLYVNFHDTHFPYCHPGIETITGADRLPRGQISPDRREALWRTYVNTAANVDRAIGRVVELVQRSRGTEPGVIVTADHGESLFDEGFLGHGYGLNDAQTRIPLVVANLPMQIPEPFGQTDLRHVLGAALRLPPGGEVRPSLRAMPEREVFQYLGSIGRPRQIASRRLASSFVYDFRNARARSGGGGWMQPEELAPSQKETFAALIHRWESVNLAERGLLPDANGGTVH